MSAAPFDVAPVQERVRALVPTLRLVAGAADYAAVKNLADFPAPCAYVVLAAEQYTSASAGHGRPGEQVPVSQDGAITFGIVVAVRNYREQRGAQVSQELIAVLGAIRDAVLGYVPPVPGARPCQLSRGRLADYDAGVALWEDVYTTSQSIGVPA